MEKMTMVTEDGRVLFVPPGSSGPTDEDVCLSIEQIALVFPGYLNSIAQKLATLEREAERWT